MLQVWIARPGDELISHGKAVSRMLNAVAGKFPIQHLREGFEHQVLVSMCMVVVSHQPHSSYSVLGAILADRSSSSKRCLIPLLSYIRGTKSM